MTVNTLSNEVILVGTGVQVLQPGEYRPVRANPTRSYAIVDGRTKEVGRFNHKKDLAPYCKLQTADVLQLIAEIPAAKSSLQTFKSMILSSNFEFTAADFGNDNDPARLDEANRAVEECERAAKDLLDNSGESLEEVAWEMLDSLVVRHKLAEVVFKEKDDGYYTLDSLRRKPHWCYRFMVDGSMTVRAIAVWNGDEWIAVNPEKFFWIAWDSKNGDPRGNSILDSVVPYVNMLLKLWPDAFQWWHEHGTPRIIVTVGPDTMPTVDDIDEFGNKTGNKITGEMDAAKRVSESETGAVVGLPYESDAKILESQRDGQGLRAAIEVLEAQIIKPILLVVQATVEARHASRADSETKKNVAENFAGFAGTHWLCSKMRKPFFELLKANHGEEYAREFCPYLSTGRINADVMAMIAQAIGVLYQSGYFTERQLLWLDDFIGLPRRKAGEDRVGPQKDAADQAALNPPEAVKPEAVLLMQELNGKFTWMFEYLKKQGMPS